MDVEVRFEDFEGTGIGTGLTNSTGMFRFLAIVGRKCRYAHSQTELNAITSIEASGNAATISQVRPETVLAAVPKARPF